MKFSNNKPFVHKTMKQYYENKQLRDLQQEFEKILQTRTVAEQYKPKKPKK
jgi:hypothetical protein